MAGMDGIIDGGTLNFFNMNIAEDVDKDGRLSVGDKICQTDVNSSFANQCKKNSFFSDGFYTVTTDDLSNPQNTTAMLQKVSGNDKIVITSAQNRFFVTAVFEEPTFYEGVRNTLYIAEIMPDSIGVDRTILHKSVSVDPNSQPSVDEFDYLSEAIKTPALKIKSELLESGRVGTDDILKLDEAVAEKERTAREEEWQKILGLL